MAAPAFGPSSGAAGGGDASRDRLVRVAVQRADANGIAAVSVRAVAHRAGVRPDQAHRWVRNHDDLLAALVEHVLTDRSRAGARPEPAHPRDQLELLAHDEWALYRRHPWLLSVLATTRPPPTPALLATVDRAVAVLIRAGYEPDDAFAAYLALSGYVQGMALLHVAEVAEQHAGSAAWDTWWRATRDRLARTGRTHGRTWLTSPDPPHPDPDIAVDRWFTFGLTRLLDGLLPPQRGSGRQPA